MYAYQSFFLLRGDTVFCMVSVDGDKISKAVSCCTAWMCNVQSVIYAIDNFDTV